MSVLRTSIGSLKEDSQNWLNGSFQETPSFRSPTYFDGKSVVSCRCCMAVKLHPTASHTTYSTCGTSLNLPSFAMLTSTARQPTQAAEWLGPHWWQQRELAHPIKNLKHLSFHPLPTSGAIVSSNSPSPANLLCDYRTCTPHTQPIDSRLAAK